MLTPRRSLGLLALGLACALAAGRSAADPQPTPAAVQARLRADLDYLASDACEGRGPGTAGIDKAADYIAAAFQAAGLRPPAPGASFFQPFVLRGDPALAAGTQLRLRGPDRPEQTLALDAQYQPLGISGTGTVEAPLVFAGFGITSDDPAYDDYKNLDAANKIVVILRKIPRYSDKQKPFANDQVVQQLSSLSAKIANAEKHKARGVILVNDRGEKDDPLIDFGYVSGAPAAIPAANVKRERIEPLVKAALGKSLTEIEEAIEADLTPRSAPLDGWSATMKIAIERKQIPVKNVVGVLEGAGPLAQQTVVFGAHYDHLGYGGRGSLAGKVRAIHHGADDNASGTSALLELARRFAAIPNRQGRRLVFIAFSGEELGLLGSKHYVDNPLFPLDATTAMINLDMVGRLARDPQSGKGKLEIGGTGTAKEFDALIDQANTRFGFDLKKSKSGVGPSDHTSFYLKGVPVFFFFTGLHREYHKPTDTADRINYEGLLQIVDLVQEIGGKLAAESERPAYVKGVGSIFSGSPRGNVPRIGIMPGNYEDEADGVLVGSVTKDGPADKGGMKDNDRIIAIGGEPVKNMTAYMTAMGKQKRGQAVEFVVIRGGQKVTLQVTPQ